MKNYWVIGDIHGEIALLDHLLVQIGQYGSGELVFVGDYIDRGPCSREVLERLMELGSDAICLMGNHELMMLNALDNLGFGHSPVEQWYYNGGEATIQSYGSSSFFSFQTEFPAPVRNFLRKLRMGYQFQPLPGQKVLVAHAGVSPFIPVADHLEMNGLDELRNYVLPREVALEDSFLWVREAFFSASPDLWEGRVVVHGHTPVAKMEQFIPAIGKQNFIFVDRDLCLRRDMRNGGLLSVDVDSGSTQSGRLTALGFLVEYDASGKARVRMRSLTVSREAVFPRDLGWMQ